MENLFLKQGYTEYSSRKRFEDYLVMGMGKAPLVMIYRSQFISQAMKGEGGISSEMVLIYPADRMCKHVLIALSENGDRLGELLQNNPKLSGWSLNTASVMPMYYFKEIKSSRGLSLPDTLVNVVEPPSYEILEQMIQIIEKSINDGRCSFGRRSTVEPPTIS